jgi:hypothetical protein
MNLTNGFQCMPNPNFDNPVDSILDIIFCDESIQIWQISSIKKVFHLEHFFTYILNFKRQNQQNMASFGTFGKMVQIWSFKSP